MPNAQGFHALSFSGNLQRFESESDVHTYLWPILQQIQHDVTYFWTRTNFVLHLN